MCVKFKLRKSASWRWIYSFLRLAFSVVLKPKSSWKKLLERSMRSDCRSTYTWIGVILDVWGGILTYRYFTVERSVGGILKRSRLEFCSAPLIDMVMCLFQRLLRLCTRRRVPIFSIRIIHACGMCLLRACHPILALYRSLVFRVRLYELETLLPSILVDTLS